MDDKDKEDELVFVYSELSEIWFQCQCIKVAQYQKSLCYLLPVKPAALPYDEYPYLGGAGTAVHRDTRIAPRGFFDPQTKHEFNVFKSLWLKTFIPRAEAEGQRDESKN